MIHFNHVTKQYSNGHLALCDISFCLAEGEIAFLTGHSGAGKTTLLKLLLMVETLDHGQIYINDRNLAGLSKRAVPHLRRQIGMIFQSPQLLMHRSVFENVALPLIISKLHHHEIKRRVRAALNKVGLLGKENLLPSALSTGEQQRVGIARAVVNRPRILLADEPTGNLDPDLSLEIMRLFKAFHEVGVTVLIATHDLSIIASLNHRIITLSAGKIIGDH